MVAEDDFVSHTKAGVMLNAYSCSANALRLSRLPLFNSLRQGGERMKGVFEVSGASRYNDELAVRYHFPQNYLLDRPQALPAFPCLADLDWPAVKVDVERQMRFPWSGGRHPWLDAAVETPTYLIGVESKRFEPFRDAKTGQLSPAYDRDVWGEEMGPYAGLRDRLRDTNGFRLLDAVQLVKHAFGLVTGGRRVGKQPVLLYLFAEPAELAGKPIAQTSIKAHREEIAEFARSVSGAEVRFAACSYREWLGTWSDAPASHGLAVLNRFAP